MLALFGRESSSMTLAGHRTVQLTPADRPLLTEAHLADRHVRVGGPGVHAADLVRRVAQHGHLDLADPAPAQHARQPLDVVGVEVREHHERDGRDTQVAQAAVDGDRVRAGVHHDGGTRPGRHDQPVALPDVARDQQPARRRPPLPGQRRQTRPRHHQHADGHRRARRGPSQQGRRGDACSAQREHDEHRADEPLRPPDRRRPAAAPSRARRSRSTRRGPQRDGPAHCRPGAGRRRPPRPVPPARSRPGPPARRPRWRAPTAGRGSA